MSVTSTGISAWGKIAEPLSWQQRLRWVAAHPLRVAFSTSFSHEDQAITHIIAEEKLPVSIFTLDTGRLFEETHALHQQTVQRYGIPIHTYFPDAGDVEHYVTKHGINGFYDSVENRKTCCHVRKVLPLARALQGVDVWISGLRREHSEERKDIPVVNWDAERSLVKFQPLIDVDQEMLDDFIITQKVPTNVLHAKGFTSIGCAPCTRAIAPGEPARAGRWWWEEQGAQECGLHAVNGRPVRQSEAADAE